MGNHNPDPGYYGISRDPNFSDNYKVSFTEIYNLPVDSRAIYKAKVKASKFPKALREASVPIQPGNRIT